MSVVTVIIGQGTQEYTFSTTHTRVVPGVTNSFNPGGVLDESIKTFIVTGHLVGASPSYSEDTFDLYHELNDVAERSQAQRFRILRDGVTEEDILPSSVIRGPFVVSFRILPTGGMWANHVAFELVVSMTTKGGQQFSNQLQVDNVRREVEVETYDDRFIRKTWRAGASGPQAVELVRSFKPAGVRENLRTIITRRIDDNSATAIYNYQPRQDKLLSEVITLTRRAGRPLREFPIKPRNPGEIRPDDENKGLLFRGRQRAAILTVTGRMQGPDITTADIPILHFAEENFDPEISRQDHERRRVPGDRELYEVNWVEGYRFLNETDIDDPDHSDHANFEDEDEPGDGSIASV